MSYTSKSIEEIEEWLKNNLTEEKYLHSIGVMDMAKMLALKFNLDIEKAKVAGLLHDCAKNLDTEEMKKLAKSRCFVNPGKKARTRRVFSSRN